jgi:hypothetical protein
MTKGRVALPLTVVAGNQKKKFFITFGGPAAHPDRSEA